MTTNIIEEEDGFYFWDDQDYLIGPFKSSTDAEKAYNASLKWQSRVHKKGLRKMREGTVAQR